MRRQQFAAKRPWRLGATLLAGATICFTLTLTGCQTFFPWLGKSTLEQSEQDDVRADTITEMSGYMGEVRAASHGKREKPAGATLDWGLFSDPRSHEINRNLGG